MDEISRLWTTFSTGYRISVSYDASVVLIDNSQPVTAPLPVLARSAGDTGPLAAPRVARPSGAGPTRRAARRTSRRHDHADRPGPGWGNPGSGFRSRPQRAPAAAARRDHGPGGHGPAAGRLAAVAGDRGRQRPADGRRREHAGEQLGSAGAVPVLTNTRPLSATLADGSATVQVTCSPPVLATQTVQLVRERAAGRRTAGATGTESRSSLSFALPGFTAGSYVVRLRVDGQDSIPVVAGSTSSTPTRAWCCHDGRARSGRSGITPTWPPAWRLAPRPPGRKRGRRARRTGAGAVAGRITRRVRALRSRRPAGARAARRPSRPVPLRTVHPAAVRGHRVRPGDRRRCAGGAATGRGPAHLRPRAQHPARPAWDALSPQRPLRYWRLVEVYQEAAQPLVASALRADERIVNYIKGLNQLDDRLAHLLRPAEDVLGPLTPSQEAAVLDGLVARTDRTRRPARRSSRSSGPTRPSGRGWRGPWPPGRACCSTSWPQTGCRAGSDLADAHPAVAAGDDAAAARAVRRRGTRRPRRPPSCPACCGT